MTTTTIPNSTDEILDEFGAKAKAVAASRWELAAWIASCVQPMKPGDNQHTEVSNNGHLISARAFADKGYHGFKSPMTVLRYREAWMVEVGTPPRPGEKVTLPTGPFPPDSMHRRLDDGDLRQKVEEEAERLGANTSGAIRVAEASDEAIAAAVAASPRVAKAAAKALAEVATEDEAEMLVKNRHVREKGYSDVKENVDQIKAKKKKKPGDEGVFGAMGIMFAMVNIDDALETLDESTQVLVRAMREGALPQILADPKAKAELTFEEAKWITRLNALTVAHNYLRELVERGAPEDMDDELAKLLG